MRILTAKPRLAFAAASAGLVMAVAGGAAAQSVDRYDYLQLKKQVKSLDAEVSRLRGAGAVGSRINTVEDEIQRLTSEIERLQYDQRRHEEESAKKLLDLEYRIIELEGGDPSILFNDDGKQGALAPGGAAPVAPPPSQQSAGGGGDRAPLDAAVAAFNAGDMAEAEDRLSDFLSRNPGGPLAAEAHYHFGKVYLRTGRFQDAAKHFLDGATLSPNSPSAPDSLFQLGVTLGVLGKTDVACSTLREVGVRYPGLTGLTERASVERSRLGCN